VRMVDIRGAIWPLHMFDYIEVDPKLMKASVNQKSCTAKRSQKPEHFAERLKRETNEKCQNMTR